MSKVYKSFQVKIDRTAKTKIETMQVLAQEKKDDGPKELPDEFFKEVPLELLTKKQEEGPAKPPQPPASATREPTGDSSGSGEAALPGGKLGILLANINRRTNEMAQEEQRLKAWEKSLLDREKYIETEEGKLHQEIMTKRKHFEEETAKMMEMTRKSADNILKTANAEAESLRKAAKLETDEVKNKAHKEGYALGEEKGVAVGEKTGFEEGKMEWQSLIQETETLITELQTSRMGILKSSEEEMVRLIIAFAKRVLKSECMTRPEIILNNIDAALNKISEVDKIVLRINIRDKSMAESRKSDFMSRLSGVGELRIIEDPNLTPGGLKIETGVGTIDATIESQADELEKIILKTLKKAE